MSVSGVVSTVSSVPWMGATSDGESPNTSRTTSRESAASEGDAIFTPLAGDSQVIDAPQRHGTKRKHTEVSLPSYMTGDEVCVVCGDKASGLHYKAMTCEGCKGFFRREVQKKRELHCTASNNCVIDKSTRRQCQLCRYNKCIATGMITEAVLNEPERAKQQQLIQHNKEKRREATFKPAGEAQGEHDVMTHEQRTFITRIVEAYERIENSNTTYYNWEELSHAIQQLEGYTALWQQSAEMLNTSIDKVVQFAIGVPAFCELRTEDQAKLVFGCYMDIMCLLVARSYDSTDHTLTLQNGAKLTRGQIDQITEIGMLVEHIFKFAASVSELRMDDTELALLAVVLLMQSEVDGLKDSEQVQYLYEKTLAAFRRYTAVGHPSQAVRSHKMLMKVAELRSSSAPHIKRLLYRYNLLPPLFLQVFRFGRRDNARQKLPPDHVQDRRL